MLKINLIALIVSCILGTVYLFNNWEEIRCKIQQPKYIDVYTTNKYFYENVRVINKAFQINEIGDNIYDVVRLYYLPSFKNEVLIEIKILDSKILSAVKYAPIEKTIWDDRQALLYNKQGQVIGGKVKGFDEYKSSVKADVDTIKDNRLLIELNEYLKHTNVFGMSSITREDENNCGDYVIFDGNTYVVVSKKNGESVNYFEFADDDFDDLRYLRTKTIINKLATN